MLETEVVSVPILAIGESLSTMSLLLKDRNMYTQLTQVKHGENLEFSGKYIYISEADTECGCYLLNDDA